MRHKLALVLANTSLLAVALVALTGPLLLGQLLGAAQSGALGVSQVAAPQAQLAVYPNTTDFAQYATFNPSPLAESLFYQTSVAFTAFAGQQAAYNGLFTLYNPGTTPLTVVVEGGNLSGQLETSMAWLTIAPENHSAVTLTTDRAEAGATVIKVADAEAFKGGAVVVGATLLKANKQSSTELRLTEPLAQPLGVGEKIYLGAILYNKQNKPLPEQTQTITLPAQGRATITLTVATDGGEGQRQIVLPISITAK